MSRVVSCCWITPGSPQEVSAVSRGFAGWLLRKLEYRIAYEIMAVLYVIATINGGVQDGKGGEGEEGD